MTIELRLSAIYRAAHVSIPGQATLLSEQGTVVGDSAAAASAELFKLGHELSGDFSSLGEEVVVQLRRIVQTMNDCSLALDRIADDFASTDADAAGWFREHGSWLERNGYQGKPGRVPLPAVDGES